MKQLVLIYGFQLDFDNKINTNIQKLNEYSNDELNDGNFDLNNPRLLFIKSKTFEYLGIPIYIKNDLFDFNLSIMNLVDLHKDLYNLMYLDKVNISYKYKPNLYIFYNYVE